MDDVGRKRAQRPRREFTPEFKAEIVALCLVGDRSIRQVARSFDLTPTAVRNWVEAAGQRQVEAGEGVLGESDKQELDRLRRENRRLREDLDVLKRATAFFARETR